MSRKLLNLSIPFGILILTLVLGLMFHYQSRQANAAGQLLAPASSHTWPAVRHDPGRTGYNPSETILGPKLSLYARFAVDDPDASLFNNILVDDTQIYVQNQAAIWVYDRETLSFQWSFDDCLSGTNFCLLGGLAEVSQDRLVLVKQGLFTAQSELVVLDAATGDVEWTRPVPDFLPVFALEGNRVHLMWQDSGYHLIALSIFTGNPLTTEQTGSFEGAFANGKPVIADGRIFFVHENEIISHATSNSVEIWGYTDTQITGTLGYDLVALDSALLVAQGERVFALNPADKTLLWSNPAESCDSGNYPTNNIITTDGTTLIVNGICNEDVVAYDVATGTEQWRKSIGPFPPSTAVAGANGVFYVASLPSPTEYYIWAYDFTDGTLLEQFSVDVGDQTPVLAISDTFLYTVSGINNTGVQIFERTPADLSAAVLANQAAVCGAMEGGTITYQFAVINSGPGDANNVTADITLPPGTAVFTTTQGSCVQGNSPTCNIGDLVFNERIDITAKVTASVSGTFSAGLTVESEPRDPLPENDSMFEETPLVIAPKPPSGVDLQVNALEVTQGIQNLANSVNLVAGKPTVARAYIQTNGPEVNNVTAVLHGTNISNGTPLPESPLSPATDFTCVNVDGSPPDRTQLGETVLFKLPDGWDSGGVNLEVEINPGGPIPDTNTSNNTLAEAIPYRSLPHACIRTYRVRTEGSFRPPDGGIIIDPLPPKYYLTRDPDNLLDRALSLLPLPEIVIYAESNILEEWEFVQWGPYDLNDDDDDSWKILHTLWWHDQLSDDPDECDGADARTHYMGMVHQGTTGNFAGIALIDQLVVKVSNESLPGRDFNNPWGGRTLAHELGHNYWRGHVDCGDIPWYQPDDDDYPYGCDIGPDDPEAFYGLDLFSVDTDISALEVIEPTAAGDLMSYAPKRWVSDYTWRKIWLDLCLQQSNLCIYTGNPENPVIFQTTVPESPQKTLVPDDLLIISGLLTTDTLQIESAYRFTQTLVTNGKFEKLLSEQNNLQADAGDFVVQLLDSGGNILHSQPFTPSHASDSTSILSMFGLAVPFNPATAEIKVTSILTPTIVSTRTVSANAPTVEIISPNGGETITDTMTISWVGSDVDNDPLVYTVQYSADLGQTWRVLAANIYTSTFTVDSSLLPGSQEMGLVQVIPSDGVNTGSDRSDEPFTVPPRSPLASIQDPDNGAVFTPGDFVTLRGVGYDPEDGQITGSSLSWSIEGLGIVGTGQQISLFDLDPGTYEATLTATDSDEMSTSDTITFRVGTPNLIFLPMILQ